MNLGKIGFDGRFYLLDFARYFPPEKPFQQPYFLSFSSLCYNNCVVLFVSFLLQIQKREREKRGKKRETEKEKKKKRKREKEE